MTALLRHLVEWAESEGLARARFMDELTRLLDLEPSHRLDPLLEAVTRGEHALDLACVLAAAGATFRLQAAVGLSVPIGTSYDSKQLSTSLHRTPSVKAIPPTAALFPEGTLAACEIPLLTHDGSLLGLAFFGSRTAHELHQEELLLARVAAERAARVLESVRTDTALAGAMEAASHTSHFRDQVLAIVGHDLRNPLGAIVMSVVLLKKRGSLEGWQAKTIDRIHSSSLRMGRIINDLLTYARTRLGDGIPVTPRPTHLGELTRRVMDELRAAHPGTVLTLTAAGDLTGHWDPDRLEQVLSNLVSNAVDHGDEGYPIEVKLLGSAETVHAEIVNQGEVPREAMEHAFEAFHRGPEQTGHRATGLGLGLFIAREIVLRHGGDIAIASIEGATRITLRLPRAQAPYPNANPLQSSRA